MPLALRILITQCAGDCRLRFSISHSRGRLCLLYEVRAGASAFGCDAMGSSTIFLPKRSRARRRFSRIGYLVIFAEIESTATSLRYADDEEMLSREVISFAFTARRLMISAARRRKY